MTYSRRTWVNGNVWDQTSANDFEGRIETEFTSQDSRITTNTSGVSAATSHAALTTTAHGGIVASTSPRLLAGGGTTGQVLAKASGTDYDTVWSSLGLPQLVTSLPGSPVDGQEIYFQADATNGVIWHLRYRTASASTYKWEFVGGSPLWSSDDTTVTVAVGGFVAQTGAPSITVPLAGDYDVDIGVRHHVSGAGGQTDLGIGVNGSVITNDFGTESAGSVIGQSPGSFSRRKTAMAASTVLSVMMSATSASGNNTGRWLRVRPVRVG